MKSLLTALALCLLLNAPAFAKRSPPKAVEPLKGDYLEYRVPHNHLGCVEAWDVANNTLIWRRQIYVVRYDADLERDIQDVFITSLSASGKKLLIKNERNHEYELDLDALEVKPLKGPLVESVRR